MFRTNQGVVFAKNPSLRKNWKKELGFNMQIMLLEQNVLLGGVSFLCHFGLVIEIKPGFEDCKAR